MTAAVPSPLAVALGRALAARGRVVATAESCTGGLIAGAITDVPGSSGWFDRGFVTYSNAAKSEALGVRAVGGRLILGPELFGSSVLDGFLDKRTTPVEILIGGKYRVTDSLRIGAGAGPGLTRGIGAPSARVVASLEWMPAAEEPAIARRREPEPAREAPAPSFTWRIVA